MISVHPSLKKSNISSVALWIAIIIHFFGLIGIMFFNRSWFVALTPVNLLIMFVLVWMTQPDRLRSFYLFLIISWCTGMLVEIIGVQTGILFGDYLYGEVLGPGIYEVPFLIGVNWFVIVYCSGAVAEQMVSRQHVLQPVNIFSADIVFSLVGSLITTIFDWLMEPVAISLGYWLWKNDGSIPVYNYVCWFGVSFFLLLISRLLKLRIKNRFAIYLLIIQSMFFIILRIFFSGITA